MNKLFKYSIGTDPYPDLSTTLWGEDRGKFPDLDSALHGLFLAHPFPVALTGRWQDRFFPGISLVDTPADEVVQVWSTEPAIVKRFAKALKEQTANDESESRSRGYVPHDGSGNDMGLACEVHVGMIARFQVPKVAGLLTDGKLAGAATSPAGARMLSFTPNARNALQVRLFQAQLAGIGGRHDLGEMRAHVREQLKSMNEGIALMNAYCNGTETLQQMRRGDRAPASDPYCLFQTRVYLDEELGLIANLLDMDHLDVPKIDDWLFAEDRWKKLLPLPKCILVTRIRRDDKQYPEGFGAFAAAYHNAMNMAHLVWIRDGDCVWRFGTDVKFEERIFPAADDAAELVARIQERIWKLHYAPRKDQSSGDAKGDGKPTWETAAPVPVTWEDEVKFPTLEEWLASDRYTKELNLSIHRRAADALRQHARDSMPFALLLQGIVDLKGILNIPPGTDLFDSETQARFIRLISDFSGGIADSRLAEQFERHVNWRALKPGDRIVGWRWDVYTTSDRWAGPAKWNLGKKDSGLFVFTVHHVEHEEGKKYWGGLDHDIFVHHQELKKRWLAGRHWRDDANSPFNKAMDVAPVCANFLPLDLPESLAEKLLDDRNWKAAHQWAVPLLAQWPDIRKQFRAIRDEKPFPLKMRQKWLEVPKGDES